ncbi:OsmC family protein [Flavobacterium sp. SUN046]|uniref:OsmC family protein n=1 Tax=Flavobacterium sp. SUN046 TaxID=3002440 RepID=UPI002DBA7D1B|nr:OsmC family protein [Flavobacterium sp. SUN046]MEC4048958.1 OsmC family protein [Flavobacterium sp. SUN046]
MATSKITYLGDLRTTSTHLQSGTEILSDAPVDNHGKGQAFSPTDLLANALGSCMITVMAIKANEMGIELKGTTAEVTKIMQAEPRRIKRLEVTLNIPVAATDKDKTILERVGRTCPVYLSLHPDVEKEIIFNWL